MANNTRGNRQGSTTGNRQGASQGNMQSAQTTNESNVIVESEQIRRLRVGEITYETASDSDSGEEQVIVKGDGMKELTLNHGDVDQLSRFFSRVVRYNANVQRNGPQVTDGRGQVNHPETDSRLKGNENLRPGDPGGAKRAGK